MQTQKALKATAITALTIIFATHAHAPRMLQHANIFHLAVNAWTMWNVWRKPLWLILPAAAFGQLGMLADTQAVGASSMLFALVALQWNIYDCKLNRWLIAATLAVSAILPQLSLCAHLIPFSTALAAGFVAREAHNKLKKRKPWTKKSSK